MTEPADDLMAFIDASPTPFHAVAEAARLLEAAGFQHRPLGEPWTGGGSGFVHADGALIAWIAPERDPARPMRIIAAHTDSPNLRLKPHPTIETVGLRQLAVEPYGGLLLHSWLDRDLGVAGRAIHRASDGSLTTTLITDRRPLVHLAQLAIHLDRSVGDSGPTLNRAQHLQPIWGLANSPTSFTDWLGAQLGHTDHVVGFDLMLFDPTPSCRVGADGEFVSAGRLDNLCSSFGAVTAIIAAGPPTEDSPVACIALFDHEEVGSTSARGAASRLLSDVVSRLVAARGGTEADAAQARAGSLILSADMAHATHPNYPERHDPRHHIRLGGGPAIKVNENQRYATDGATAARFRSLCHDLGVPVQTYSHRNDLPCGSTVGPTLAAGLGVPTVDVGMPQLAMHSIRELMAADDVAAMCVAFTGWLTPPR